MTPESGEIVRAVSVRLLVALLCILVFCGCATLPDPTTGQWLRVALPGGSAGPEGDTAVLRCVEVSAGATDLYLSADISDDVALRLEGRQESLVPAGSYLLKVWRRQHPTSSAHAVGNSYVSRRVAAGIFCHGELELTMEAGCIYTVYASDDIRDCGMQGQAFVRVLRSRNGIDYEVLAEHRF